MVKIWNMRNGPIPSGYVRVDRGSNYGNPFDMQWDESRRQEVCNAFQDYAKWRLVYEPDWLVPLKGQNLACWCAPKRCHAEILAKLANEVKIVERKRPVLVFDKPEPPCQSQHAKTFFNTDSNCGGFFVVCWECGWVVDSGMIGHN